VNIRRIVNRFEYPAPESCKEQEVSLRDWFAGQALHGLTIDAPLGEPHSTIAAQAYALADAMLAERNK
jgi:hypothetical protein